MGRHGGRPSLEMLQWVKRSTKPDWLHLRGDRFYGEVVSLINPGNSDGPLGDRTLPPIAGLCLIRKNNMRGRTKKIC
jgi:hypothetical protein